MTASGKKSVLKFFDSTPGQEVKLEKNSELSWFEQEQEEKRQLPDPKAILKIFWDERIIKYKKDSVDMFKNYIQGVIFSKDEKIQEKIEKLFFDATTGKINFDTFAREVIFLGPKFIYAMNGAEKLIPVPSTKFQDFPNAINEHDILNIQQYMRDKKMSASVTLRANSGALTTPNFSENQSSFSFAMHSIGKVFTGMLTLIMVRHGILSEEDLNSPIQLNDAIIKQLSPAIQKQLKDVTLHQVMTHHAGLGDYLEEYIKTITESKKAPEMKRVEDFLPFVDKKVFPINQFKYSNAGILLVGFALKHAYEKKLRKSCNYNDILKKFIIDKAKMKCFSPWRPKNGKYNPDDKAAKNIVGSPAGGYWTTAEDLAKFGCWIYETCSSDPKMKRLIEKYGQEFYSEPSRELIAHGGAINSSSAYFSVSLKTGAVIAIMSDQPDAAFDLNAAIQKNIIADKSLDITGEEMADSAFGLSSNKAKRFRK